jgi:uncharacterized membrane protein
MQETGTCDPPAERRTRVRLAPTPREILDERFAKGEIDWEDYEACRKALTDS